MPIYEYMCEACGAVEEVLQKISDRPKRKCSRCSGKVHKLISQSSFHLKGTGWYATDYAGKGNAGAGKGNAGNKPKPAKTEGKAARSDTTTSKSSAPKSSADKSV